MRKSPESSTSRGRLVLRIWECSFHLIRGCANRVVSDWFALIGTYFTGPSSRRVGREVMPIQKSRHFGRYGWGHLFYPPHVVSGAREPGRKQGKSRSVDPKMWSSRRWTGSIPYTARPIARQTPSTNPRICCLAVNPPPSCAPPFGGHRAAENRNAAQTAFTDYLKSNGKSLPLLVARFAARQGESCLISLTVIS